jgi:hypothetical protein
MKLILMIVFLLSLSACSADPGSANRPASGNFTDPLVSPKPTPAAKSTQVPEVAKVDNETSPNPEPKNERWQASPGIPKDVAEIMEAAIAISDKGVRLPRPRGNDFLSVKKCGILSGTYRREVEQLQRKAGKLPNKYAIRLNAALSHLESCVSCSPTARMKCSTVKSTLLEANRTFLE